MNDHDYEISVKDALRFGYKRATSPEHACYRGECFVKDSLFWIHALEALKLKLEVETDEAVKAKKYNLDDYNNNQSEKLESENILLKSESEMIKFKQDEAIREELESIPDFEDMSEDAQEYLRSNLLNRKKYK